MRYVLSILLAGVCCSCSTAPTTAPSATPTTAPIAAVVPDHRGPIILMIHSRDKVVVVRAGEAGATYSLMTVRGELLVPDMTLGQLAQKDAELGRKVEGMQADSTWAGSYLATGE